MKVIALACLGLLLCGCSDENPKTGTGENLWKTQTDARKKAQGVEQTILDSARRHDREIEAQSR